jgi:phage-related protein
MDMVARRLKPIAFLGDALDLLRAFPEGARKEAGVQLHKQGLTPTDWKPMRAIGPGVTEIRIHDESGAFRVIYIATRDSAICVLHAFQKKTPRTAKRDLDLAAARLRQI